MCELHIAAAVQLHAAAGWAISTVACGEWGLQLTACCGCCLLLVAVLAVQRLRMCSSIPLNNTCFAGAASQLSSAVSA
jgi:hypothetical protein